MEEPLNMLGIIATKHMRGQLLMESIKRLLYSIRLGEMYQPLHNLLEPQLIPGVKVRLRVMNALLDKHDYRK
jgi:hypothetical protein